jgi:hypothetical protein
METVQDVGTSLQWPAGLSLLNQGILFTMPYRQSNGGLWYLTLDNDKNAHALIAGGSSTMKRRTRWADVLERSALVPVLRIDSSYAPSDARLLLEKFVKDDHPHQVLIIEELDSIFSGLRSKARLTACMSLLQDLLDNGSKYDKHVVLFQTITDHTYKELGAISNKFTTIISTGRLTPIASQMVYNNGFGSSLPNSSHTAGWMKNGNSGVLHLN